MEQLVDCFRGIMYLKCNKLYIQFLIACLCSSLMNLEVLHLTNNNFNHNDIEFALNGVSSLKSLYLRCRSIFSMLYFRNFHHLLLVE